MPVSVMSTVYFNFFLVMWMMRRITAEQLLLRVPKYLTQEEYDIIIATPQIPE
jgi:hypothetical protein